MKAIQCFHFRQNFYHENYVIIALLQLKFEKLFFFHCSIFVPTLYLTSDEWLNFIKSYLNRKKKKQRNRKKKCALHNKNTANHCLQSCSRVFKTPKFFQKSFLHKLKSFCAFPYLKRFTVSNGNIINYLIKKVLCMDFNYSSPAHVL